MNDASVVKSGTQNIVFVCVENSCRSQLAQALAVMQGDALVAVFSAGSKPSGVINPKAILSMQSIGYDLTQHSSDSLEALPKVAFDAVITMGCGDECPMIRGRIKEDWGLPDPKHLPQAEFDEMRDLIAEKVKSLFEKLKELKA